MINTSIIYNSSKTTEQTLLINSWLGLQEKELLYYRVYWYAVFAGGE